MSCTCTENCSKADVTGVAENRFAMSIPMTGQSVIGQPKFLAANAEVEFGRTFAGLARCHSKWIASFMHLMSARCSWRLEPQEWLSPPLALSRMSAVRREPFMSGLKFQRMPPRSMNAIWAEPEKSCRPSSASSRKLRAFDSNTTCLQLESTGIHSFVVEKFNNAPRYWPSDHTCHVPPKSVLIRV